MQRCSDAFCTPASNEQTGFIGRHAETCFIGVRDYLQVKAHHLLERPMNAGRAGFGDPHHLGAFN